ncbi:MAG: triose-phosphate isomerase [Oscillospiraceae bacterium]|jgi:triosephosphate isomerase|nr:triose-phosphate isomerase [Oscillospiraceae bacterium]MDE6997183.1 triose-phosphate isomerase [Oscillospiraceae bacterium]
MVTEGNKLYFGTNTKMYKGIGQTLSFLNKLQALTEEISRERMELFVIPSFTALDAAGRCVRRDKIRLGAQNMAWEDEGQFSGEISPLMLKEVGVELVMIGHSERRHILMETDEMEGRKVRCALRHGLTPLLCIGETGGEKALGIADEVLRIQLKTALGGVPAEQAGALRIAYEPVWAIGTSGVPAAREYAEEKHAVIRRTLAELYGESCAADIPLLYGGSVNRTNAVELIQTPNIDGLFIGRSAWAAEEFSAIIQDILAL